MSSRDFGLSRMYSIPIEPSSRCGNLHARLQRYETEVLRFAVKPHVSFARMSGMPKSA